MRNHWLTRANNFDDVYGQKRQIDWESRIRTARLRPVHRQNIVDDGFYSRMAVGAKYEGVFETPTLKKPDKLIIPSGAVPFSMLGRAELGDCCVFFEKDPMFSDALLAIDDCIDSLMKFETVSTPDCSLYVDMPLGLQITNIHMSRLFGHHCQQLGKYVIPTVRWGDWRSYTGALFGEPFAFAGLPKNSIYWIGTYGCCKKPGDKERFREGLTAMLDYLEPEIVLVYGAMPDSIFGSLTTRTKFIRYPDWISRKKGGARG